MNPKNPESTKDLVDGCCEKYSDFLTQIGSGSVPQISPIHPPTLLLVHQINSQNYPRRGAAVPQDLRQSASIEASELVEGQQRNDQRNEIDNFSCNKDDIGASILTSTDWNHRKHCFTLDKMNALKIQAMREIWMQYCLQ